MTSSFLPFCCEPGITRDGTPFDSQTYVDGEWVRFYKRKPKKMGGYENIANDYDKIIRTIESFHIENTKYFVCGTVSEVFISELNVDGKCLSRIPITPEDFVLNDSNVWTFDFVFCDRYESSIASGKSTPIGNTGKKNYLIAHVVPSMGKESNTIPGQLYYWEISKDNISKKTKLQPIIDYQSQIKTEVLKVTCTGSITVIGSYIFAFGNNGEIRWNNGQNINAWCINKPPKNNSDTSDNKVSTLGGGATVFGDENFLCAFPSRSGNSLGGLFWSRTSVVSASLVPIDTSSATNANFSFSCASTLSTCLSKTSICTVEPVFYWVGINTFYTHNGSVSEVVNETNKLFFFENLNKKQLSKIYSFVNLRYHEWWILFPKGDSTECNHAIIHNYEYQCWYDTPIERAASIRYNNVMFEPVLTSSVSANSLSKTSKDSFPIYLHEKGVDHVDYGNASKAINSSITACISKPLGNDIASKSITLKRIIYDIKQSKDMSCTIFTSAYPRTVPDERKLQVAGNLETSTLNIEGTIVNVKFTSNAIGGDYHFGNTLLECSVNDGDRASGGKEATSI